MVEIKFSGGQPQLFTQPWVSSTPSQPVKQSVTRGEAVDYLLKLMTEMAEEIGDLKAKIAAFDDARAPRDLQPGSAD